MASPAAAAPSGKLDKRRDDDRLDAPEGEAGAASDPLGSLDDIDDDSEKARIRDAMVYRQELGSLQNGGQASIFVGFYRWLPCVVKVMMPEKRHRQTELRALQAVGGHPHIVHWHAAHVRGDDSFVVCLELAYCDVLEVLHASEERGLKARYRLREWMLQLAVALQAVHDKGVAHRDIKPENLLLCTRHKASLKSALPEEGEPDHFAKPHVGLPVQAMHSLARSILADLEAQHPHVLPAAQEGDEQAVEKLLLAMPALHKQYRDAAVKDVLGDDIHPMRPILKLCDFGYASTVREGESVPVGYSPVGSMRYAAPEVYMRHLIFTEEFEFIKLWGRDRLASLQLEPYDSRLIDVWSFGVTVYVLVFGSMPFRAACVNDRRFRAFVRESDPDAIAQEVCAPESVYWGASYDQRPWKWPKGATPAIKHLLQQCMRVDPQQRWTFDKIRKHPWFGNPDWLPPQAVGESGAAPGVAPHSASSSPPAHSGVGATRGGGARKGGVRFADDFEAARVAYQMGTGVSQGAHYTAGALSRSTGGAPQQALSAGAAEEDIFTELGIAPMAWLNDIPPPLGDFDREAVVPQLPARPCESPRCSAFVREASSAGYDSLLHSQSANCSILGSL